MKIQEKDITICGHGSGRPSLKNMETYLGYRYGQQAANGKRKGLVEVRRLKGLTDSERAKFVHNYRTILGRNNYSQEKRQYVYRPSKDGRYYSDCSSSGCSTFQRIGHSDVPLLSTAGIHGSSLFETVFITIQNGHITNPELLKVGDCLLFRGNDPSRPLQIGHVEYVYAMPDTKKYVPGWHQDERGWWYADTEKSYLRSCWKILNRHWYYFDSFGYAVTGLQYIKETAYFFMPSGDLQGALCHTDDNGALIPWEV